MSTNTEALRAAFESRELDQLLALLDARVVWLGIQDTGSGAEPNHDDNHDHAEHDVAPMCTDREQVRDVFEGFLGGAHPGMLGCGIGDRRSHLTRLIHAS